jgi:hypothetical protein
MTERTIATEAAETTAKVIDFAAARATLRPPKPASFAATLTAALQNIDEVSARYNADQCGHNSDG